MKLTNKQKVLKVHPKAHAAHFAGGYFVYTAPGRIGSMLIGGSNLSFRQAWANAAAGLHKGKK